MEVGDLPVLHRGAERVPILLGGYRAGPAEVVTRVGRSGDLRHQIEIAVRPHLVVPAAQHRLVCGFAAHASSYASGFGGGLSPRKRSNVHGHVIGTPRSSRYQLRQPLLQIVLRAASTRSASSCSVAGADTAISRARPVLNQSTSFAM